MSALYLLSSQICETNVLICTIDFLTMAPVTCFCFAYRLICSSLYYLHLWRLIINTCFGFDFVTVTKKPKLPTSSQVVSCKMQTLYSIRNKDTYGTYLSETKFVADTTTSSVVCTMTGILRQPGDFRILDKSFMVSWSTLGGHMSILVTTTNTGTLSASASPRCSEWQKSSHK